MTHAALVQGIAVVLRDCLDHIPLSRSVPDADLKPHAEQLLKRSGEGELALLKPLMDIQVALGLVANASRCKDIASRISALVKNSAN
jgi:hypothetical protein